MASATGPGSSDRKNSGLLPPALIVLTILVCGIVVSLRKAAWFDEYATIYLARDPSFSHMYASLQNHFNMSPPVYHVMVWLWARVLGDSAVAIRLLSTLGIAGAYLIMWRLLRKRFGPAPGFFALSLTLATPLVLYHESEARCYGVLLFFTALAMATFDTCMDHSPNNNRSSVYNFLAHFGLILTHVFGAIYGVIMLMCSAIEDHRRRTIHRTYYLSAVAAWLLFTVLWLPVLLRQSRAFYPYSWVDVPDLEDLAYALCLWFKALPLVCILSLLLCWLRSRQPRKAVFQDPQWRLIACAVASIIIPPVLTFGISHRSTSVFVPRYFIPGTLSWSIVLAALCAAAQDRFGPWLEKEPWKLKGSLVPYLMGSLLLIFSIYKASETEPTQPINTQFDLSHYSSDLPVVCESAWDYMCCHFTTTRPSRYYFVLDAEAAQILSRRLDGATSGTAGTPIYVDRTMHGLNTCYPDSNVMEWSQFIQTHSHFLLLHRDFCKWSSIRLKDKPGYDVTTDQQSPFFAVLDVRSNGSGR